jgi:hypothetical protein
MGVMACQPSSHFSKAYHDGIHKSKFWESTFEDALDVCAKAARIASIVYHNCYKDVYIPIFYSFRTPKSQIPIELLIMAPTLPTC